MPQRRICGMIQAIPDKPRQAGRRGAGVLPRIALALAVIGSGATRPAAPISLRAAQTPAESTPSSAQGVWATDQEKLELIDATLSLTSKEEQTLALAGGASGADVTAEPAFRLLAEKAAALPELTGREAGSLLDAPSYLNLLRHPERYRGRPIRLRVRMFAASDVVLDDGLADPAPTSPSTLTMLDCFVCDAGEAPIIVYSLAEKAEIGKPDRLEDGQAIYDQGLQFELAGVFYRVVSGRDRNDRPREWPVVLAWQMHALPGEKDGSIIIQLFLLAIMLLIGYLIVRRSVRRIIAQEEAPAYRRRRHTPVKTEPSAAPMSPQADVDPRLKAEVEAERERTDPIDGTEDKG